MEIATFERFDLRFVTRAWDFADVNRAAIDARFVAKQKSNPALWNGRVLLAHEYEVAGGVCRGALLETDFASFNAWRDWGRPPAAIVNCFAAAVLRSADGAFLLGEMGAHTANAGQIYFPCGTPEPSDVVNGRVDMEHSARHELKDETGLDFADLRLDPNWISLRLETWAMAARIVTAPVSATELRERIRRHLASQPQPELADIHIVRGPADLDSRMPAIVSALLCHRWR